MLRMKGSLIRTSRRVINLRYLIEAEDLSGPEPRIDSAERLRVSVLPGRTFDLIGPEVAEFWSQIDAWFTGDAASKANLADSDQVGESTPVVEIPSQDLPPSQAES
ncbi:MAG: hypothetical protein IRY99_26845 [Isosphaeraceae bacterium]|nr:hypothetical protein [Isosphaeraceae bacterium]